MEVWQWVLVYALLLVLIQVFVYFYLRSGDDERSFGLSNEGDRTGSTQPSGVPGQSFTQPRQHRRDPDDAPDDVRPRHAVSPDDDAIICPHCGARNERESIYTYCRSCTTQLGV